jgi:hypothetical protein
MLSPLRARRAVFWHLASDRIVAAVLSRSEREPVLERCAASYSPPVSAAAAAACFAPGVVEVAWVLDGERLPQVAALSSSFCRVARVDDEDDVDAPETSSRSAVREVVEIVRGADDLEVRADEAAVAQAAALFRRARLRLVALDVEFCALSALAEVLGVADREAARRQHLSAVAVLPECEAAAEALGQDLAVPVGLAISWFGATRAH